jgi:hypothetical protein
MCILPPDPSHASHAALLSARQRQQLARAALAGQPVTQLAAQNHVSRKFVYQQLHRASAALDQAFDPPAPHDDVLFWLPVSKPWLRQLVLGLVLICHSSLRGACELLADVFDYPLSLGSAHNILRQAVAGADQVEQQQGLSAVRLGAHDELFQAGWPVLVGCDVHSTYCYLLSREEQRDGDTWAVRLLELRDRGFAPQATIADFGTGLRAGQQQALPGVPCRGDIFHPLRDFQALVSYLDNRAYEAISCRTALQHKQARFERRQGRKDRGVAMKAACAARGEGQAVALADDVGTLLSWWRQDVLAVAGPGHATRQALHDWIVSELKCREPLCPHRIRPVRVLLENQRDGLLAFAQQLDDDVRQLAGRLRVSEALVREAVAVGQMGQSSPARWQRERELWRQLGERYAALRVEVERLAAGVVRASSVIENLNSRLRNYFLLRKQLGPDYLKLLKFYLNHRRLARSEHPQREGKSPRELLTGQGHAHWLELLGYQRFSRQ